MNREATYGIVKTKPGLSPLFLLILTANLFFWIHAIYALGVIFSIFTIVAFFKTSGFILDKENNRVKRISGYSGIQYGKWYRVPDIKYVSLLRVKQASNSNNGATSVQNSPRSSCYQINLIVQQHREKRVFGLMTTNVETARSEGVKLGAFLDLKVLDSTTYNRHWIT
ncbi:MAG: hypothetical protein JEZ09_00960 [Salinivirgaceae bacterium]|nr:hypothetical protein [Salinivirgaceae bacterium]